MEARQGLSNRLGRAFWAIALGFAISAAALYFLRLSPLWSAAAGVIAAALASLIPARKRANVDAGRAQENDPLAALFAPLARDVFAKLPDPLMLLDAAERVLLVNDPMRLLAGASSEHKHVSAILRTPSLLTAIAHTAGTGESQTVEVTFHVPVERTYLAHVMRAGTDPSQVIALVLHDLTSLKRSEQMRVDFVANASHELRTPLAAVTGFIETLKGHARDDAAARERFLDIMTIEAGRMRRLIDDLLSLSRIELNEHVPPSGEISLETVARDAVAALSPLARADNITVEVAAERDLPPVAGERDELMQLFQNLVHNAIKYGRPGGHVWVDLALVQASGGRGADSVITVRVRDDGEGIPAEAIPRLTERFYRVDVKRSREKGGTGLGLAIVKHIANRHQGRLQIESRIGEGSTFTVFLPTSRRPFLASAPSVAAAK